MPSNDDEAALAEARAEFGPEVAAVDGGDQFGVRCVSLHLVRGGKERTLSRNERTVAAALADARRRRAGADSGATG